MNTKDIFNFKRFGKYFVSDLRTCAANYGLSLLTLAVLTPLALECITGVFNMIVGLTWEGAGIGMRAGIFGVAMFCMIVTMPSKCYGRLTDKQYGSFWLMLPASRLEKFISMMVICCIVAPFISICMYLGIDAVLCAIDHTCGENIIAGALSMMDAVATVKMNLVGTDIEVSEEYIMMYENGSKFIDQLTNPWLYVDELLCASLPFVLGAICFKKGKIVKTFLALAALGTAASMLATPIMMGYMGDFMTASEDEVMKMMFESGFYNSLIWMDIVGDFILYGGMTVAVWFRLKTLKH